MTNDRDDRTEDALRRALSIEAQQVSPAGDGLTKIQRRVAARDARWRWMRPALAGSVAVAVIAAGVGGYAIARHNSDGNAKVQVAHSNTPAPHEIASDGFPTAAIFPFTAASQEHAWEQQYNSGGSMPWISDPAGVAEPWVQNYLKQGQDIGVVSKSVTTNAADVTLGRKVGGVEHAVTVVHLVKFGEAWLVTGASDASGELAFIAPTPGSSVTSPLTVTGPGYGVDERAEVEVRDATTPDLFGSAESSVFGSGTAQWSATVPVTPTSDAGVIVATVASAADGGVGALAAEKVSFGGSAGHTASAGAFYGVQNGTVMRFNAATGASEGAVAGTQSEGTAFEVREFGDTLYFTARTSDCLYLYSEPTSGGSPAKVMTADPDYGVVGFDVSADGTRLTYAESSGCNQSRAGMGKLVFGQISGVGSSGEVAFPSEPPAIESDPVWESDGVHIDAFIRTGMSGYIARYNTQSENQNAQPNTNACPGLNVDSGLPDAITMSPDGTLWVAVETGSSVQVLTCTGTNPTTQFTLTHATSAPAIAINSTGSAVVADGSGKVWTWNGQGEATQLSTPAGVTSVTW